jgi:hypothetical protein
MQFAMILAKDVRFLLALTMAPLLIGIGIGLAVWLSGGNSTKERERQLAKERQARIAEALRDPVLIDAPQRAKRR